MPFFDPLYNLTVLVWMGAVAAIIASPFSKRFRGFAAFLAWITLFPTFVGRGSYSQAQEISTLSTLFNISSSITAGH
jgi:hypothetical protein